MTIDTAVEMLEQVANFMRGVALDPRVPPDAAEALRNKCAELDKLTEEHEEAQYDRATDHEHELGGEA